MLALVRTFVFLGLVVLCLAPAHASATQQQYLVASSSGQPRVLDQEPPHNLLEQGQWTKTREVLQEGLSLKIVDQDASTGWLEVAWEGVEEPEYDDYVAVYMAGVDPSSTAPIKFKWAVQVASHMEEGKGRHRFKLINYRQDVQLAFVRGGLTAPRVAAWSEPVRCAAPNQPLQAHLALTGNPSEMVVQWTTASSTAPQVKYGLAPGKYDHTVTATSHTYTREEMCGGAAAGAGWSDPGQQHVAVLGHLEPATRYYYVYGDPAWGWGAEQLFVSAPRPGMGLLPASSSMGPHAHDHGVSDGAPTGVAAGAAGSRRALRASGSGTASASTKQQGSAGRGWIRGHEEAEGQEAGVGQGWASHSHSKEKMQKKGKDKDKGAEAVRVIVTADMGQAEEDGCLSLQDVQAPSLNTTRLMAQAAAEGASLALHFGDISYARGYASQWDNFFTQIGPVAGRMPYMVNPGNHEIDWPGIGDRFDAIFDSGGECGVVYAKRFTMPTQGRPDPWYSFKYGPMHILMYSTEHPTSPGTPQYDFIARDLASVDRKVTPWLIVGGHRPMYVSSNQDIPPDGDISVAAALRADLEPLLLQHKVDLTFHGHHHSYQRTCPVANLTCVGYDDHGVAKGPVHIIIGNGGAGLSLNLQHPQPEYIAALQLWWGFGKLEVTRTTLALEVLTTLDGSLMDSMVLRKAPSRADESRSGRKAGTTAQA